MRMKTASLHEMTRRNDVEGVRDFLKRHGGQRACEASPDLQPEPPSSSSAPSSGLRQQSQVERRLTTGNEEDETCASCRKPLARSSENHTATAKSPSDAISSSQNSRDTNSSCKRRKHSTSPSASQNDVTSSVSDVCVPADVIDKRDDCGRTALHVAACYQRVAIARMLVEAGCDVTATEGQGRQALHEAVTKACTDLIRLLLDSGRCDVTAMTAEGTTAVMLAAFYDNPDVARLLVKAGANLESCDKKGNSCLHIALQEGSVACALYLIAAGSDVQSLDGDGRSCLHLATHCPYIRSAEIVQALLTSGYDCQRDASWLRRERQPSLFYNAQSLYTRVLSAAGVPQGVSTGGLPSKDVIDLDTDLTLQGSRCYV